MPLPRFNSSALLINPWIHDFAAYDYWSQPVGLLYLASCLRLNGLDVHLVNCLDPFHPAMAKRSRLPRRHPSGEGKFFRQNISRPAPLQNISRKYRRYGISPEVFRESLRAVKNPAAVLVTSMMTYWYPGVSEVIGMVREEHPGVPVILGGNYARLCSRHALDNSGADLVVSGEGEHSLPEILHIIGAKPQHLPRPDDLDSLPYPAFDLLNNPAQVPIITSRGCPFRCVYCASPLLNRIFRCRHPLRVADEIEFWARRGIVNFSLYDDAFLANTGEMAVPLLKEVIRRGLDCRFHCPNGLHLREISPEMADLMRRSGFQTLRFGFETATRERQISTGGKVNGEDLVQAAGHLKRAGYGTRDIGVYLLCGLPGQPVSEIRDSIDFVKDCGARPLLAEFSPIPGTAIWEDCRRAARYDIEEPLFQNNSLLPCAAADLTPEALRELKRRAKI